MEGGPSLSFKNNKSLGKSLLFLVIFSVLSLIVSAGTYTVKSGDTLWKISTRLGTDVNTLARLNPGLGNMIYPGQVIVTPETTTNHTTYTVEWGDTLWIIANKSQTTVSTIKSLNQLYSDNIYPGQKLKLPSRSANPYQPSVDQDLLARLVHSEAESEPYEGKVAVAAVVMNRLKDSRFPNTLEGVVYQKSAFEVVSNGRIYQPASQSAIQAAQAAISGWDPSYGSVFFYNPDKINGWNWILTRPVVRRIGNHVFAR